MPIHNRMTQHAHLDRLFNPRSIAVLGASETAGKIGAVPVTLLRRHGYGGAIYPVNPRVPAVQGLRAYPTLSDIEDDIDLVIVAVPAQLACDALAQARCGQVAAAVIFTSGFAETGEAGAAAQARLYQTAQDLGIRLLGPNCLGYMNVRAGVYATFSPAPMNGVVSAGDIAMVSQSGAFGAYAYSMARERGLGLSHWISTGNEADVDVSDCITWLADDPDTRIIMLYMEGCRDGEKFKRALSRAREVGKPVVVTKVGRTVSGARAAASHTAALAGDDAVYDALFRQYGAIRARTVEEFFNIGYALSVWKTLPATRALGVMTVSGGVGALMADEADESGLSLPELCTEAQARLLAKVPFAGPRNPVDVTGQAVSEPGLLLDTAIDMLEGGDYGALVVFLAAAGSSEALWPQFKTFACTLYERFPSTPVALCALFGAERRRELESMGCLVFSDPSAAVRTVAAVAGRTPARAGETGRGSTRGAAQQMTAGALQDKTLNEVQALAVLREAGVPAIRSAVATSEAEAVKAARDIGGPVVLKVVSPDILHKSDIGGVKLSLHGEDAVRIAYGEILQSVRDHAPQARLEGVLVAPMLQGGVECIMGVHRDPVFGPVVMFGLGGIFVETLKDVSFRLAPFEHEEARAMMNEIRAAGVLRGVRGAPPCDTEAVADALVALSQLAYEHRDTISQIDVNPLLALPSGEGAMAVDAVIVCERQ